MKFLGIKGGNAKNLVVQSELSGGGVSLPSQTGHTGEILTTDGTTTYWTTPNLFGYVGSSSILISNGQLSLIVANLASHTAASGLATGAIYSVPDTNGNKQLFIK
jgi:hypothetical protein